MFQPRTRKTKKDAEDDEEDEERYQSQKYPPANYWNLAFPIYEAVLKLASDTSFQEREEVSFTYATAKGMMKVTCVISSTEDESLPAWWEALQLNVERWKENK